MHALLGYRFDRLIRERLLKGVKQTPSMSLFSIRLLVRDLEREKNFYNRLLDVAPLAETEEYVIFPISDEVTLLLVSFQGLSPNKEDKDFSQFSGIELNLETRHIHEVWQRALKLDKEMPSDLVFEKNMKVFFIKSPEGTMLRFWQLWTPELADRENCDYQNKPASTNG